MKRQTKILIAAILVAVPMLLAFGGFIDDEGRTKSFNVAKGGTLEVTVDGGDIRISVWDKNEVYVKAEGIYDEDLDHLKMTQSGNDVRVELRNRWGSHGHARFDITVPSQYNADLHTAGGDIELRGTLNGTVKGATSGGNVTLGNVTSGKVDMSTSGGDMRTGDIQADVTLHTSGGNIELGAVGGEVNVSTSGGDIDVKSVGKSLKANTSGGNIDIGDVGGEAKVSTSGGDIKVRKVSGSASLNTSGGISSWAVRADMSRRTPLAGTSILRTSQGRLMVRLLAGMLLPNCGQVGRGRVSSLHPEGTYRSQSLRMQKPRSKQRFEFKAGGPVGSSTKCVQTSRPIPMSKIRMTMRSAPRTN